MKNSNEGKVRVMSTEIAISLLDDFFCKLAYRSALACFFSLSLPMVVQYSIRFCVVNPYPFSPCVYIV
ncbi:MAG: hypothetical protein P4M11_12920 [Candidatus Pacebacteria bacterium]|nr:hypothetical protein [Candidatus Paceibacterota bacterium]